MRYGKRTKPRRRLRVRPQRFIWACVLFIALCVILYSFISDENKQSQESETTEVFVSAPETPEIFSTHTTTSTTRESFSSAEESPDGRDLWTREEIQVMARTLSGECYEDKPEDKRKVCEVILNRVSAGRFGDDIISVITTKSQFCGYWNPSREISANDLEVAEQALIDWFSGDCAPLSKYLYFTAGANRENTFRENY